ncbi:DUF4235 domain-containing protein [Cyclobacterium sp.]|uniref:DUF4235 domain-containing protein n=1 Tax=Cyclobacterium sp. TaxID=1966343 RepID=UPI0019849EA9|nr:DUF4235 domain-containing protein [Cyclobacterium sp.]MBD3628066.1 DUF4235 domain-containing protein [Cyclobacterium sp.]
MKKKNKEDLQSLLIVGGTLLGSFLIKRALEKTWEKTTGKEAPKNPYERNNSLKEVLAWTITTGVLVSVTKVFIRWGLTKGSDKALSS